MAAICIAPQTIQRRYDPPPPPASSPACDRCHAIKVKCVPSNTFKGCCRCFRLQHQCSYTRARGVPGRKKKRKNAVVTTSSPKNLELRGADENCMAAGPDLANTERELQASSDHETGQSEKDDSQLGIVPSSSITVMLPRQCNSLDSDSSIRAIIWQDKLASFYTVATSFVPMLSAKVHAHICRGPPILRDLYLALCRVMRRVEAGQTEHERSDVLTCSLGLQVLRDTRIHDLPSLASFLWLGIFLKSFDRLVLGTSTHLICETTLLQLRNWYSAVSTDLEMMDPIVCLLFTDTITCLINREVPIIKFEPPRPGMVDRYAGLCCDLLPVLYEACETLATGKPGGGVLDISAWNDVYERVHHWEPQCTPETLSRFTADELTTLLTQAHAYRLGTLLILNRARYPMEVECSIQAQYADEILSQMATCLLLVGEPPPHTILPVFVAAMELRDRDRGLRALQVLQLCRGAKYYPYMTRLNDMCNRFWSERDAGGSSDWLTYLHRYHPLNIPL